MREGPRGDIVDRRTGMLGDLLQGKQLRAAERRVLFTGATDAQRLHDVAERVERRTHFWQISTRRLGWQCLAHV